MNFDNTNHVSINNDKKKTFYDPQSNTTIIFNNNAERNNISDIKFTNFL